MVKHRNRRHAPPADLAGKRVGIVNVIEYLGFLGTGPGRRKHRWKCICDCGREMIVDQPRLLGTEKIVESCGCVRIEGRRKHRMRGTPEYQAWSDIKRRCCNKDHEAYPRYGGRGITMFPQWVSDFSAFFAHVGPRPSREHSLDRIDNNGNYEPGNVRWATKTTQNRNKRTNRLLTYQGKTQTVAEWAEEIGISRASLKNRLHLGWSAERALSEPIGKPSRFR